MKSLIYLFKRNNLCCENSGCCLVKEWFYSANISGIIDDFLLKMNRAIVIYLRNGKWTFVTDLVLVIIPAHIFALVIVIDSELFVFSNVLPF